MGFGEVVLVEGAVELGLYFCCGGFGDGEVLDEFFVAVAGEALGDVVHDGAGGAPDLVCEGEVVGEGWVEAVPVDILSEHSGLLPGLDVLEAFHGFWVLGFWVGSFEF